MLSLKLFNLLLLYKIFKSCFSVPINSLLYRKIIYRIALSCYI